MCISLSSMDHLEQLIQCFIVNCILQLSVNFILIKTFLLLSCFLSICTTPEITLFNCEVSLYFTMYRDYFLIASNAELKTGFFSSSFGHFYSLTLNERNVKSLWPHAVIE